MKNIQSCFNDGKKKYSRAEQRRIKDPALMSKSVIGLRGKKSILEMPMP